MGICCEKLYQDVRPLNIVPIILHKILDLTIGSNTIIGGYVQIIDHNHQFKKSTIIRLQQAEIQHTTIGEDCWIGAGAKILCGVTIEKGVVIGANAVVTHDIPAYSIVAGVPAKIIGVRG